MQSARKYEKKLVKKKLHHQPRPSKVDSVVNAIEIGGSGIKFSDLRGSGVSLRSQKMKLPANIGQRKVKALEQAIQEFKVGECFFFFLLHIFSFVELIKILVCRPLAAANGGNM